MARHMFAGGNTPTGFFSYFDYILPVAKAKKRIFLKGSSGSGKSTFLKKAAKEFESNGFSVDYIHCSNDANSLDGIFISEKGLCIIDGTSPHVCDLDLPGIDKIVNFADYIDESKVMPYVDEIKSVLRQKKLLINKAYRYFAAAERVYSINRLSNATFLIRPELRKLIEENLHLFDGFKSRQTTGNNRKMFASAVTPDGLKSFTDTLLTGYTVYGLYAEAGMGADEFLSELQKEANERGIDTECFYCPIDPDKLEHMLIPELELAFTTINKYHNYTKNIDMKIDFGTCVDLDRLNGLKNETEYNDALFEELLDKSMDTFKASRHMHDRIEEIYSNSMDFEKLTKLTKQLISELLC